MIHHVETQVLMLLLVASFVGMGARRYRVPYTLALVVAGLVLGLVHLETLEGIELNADLLLLLFLPALLFEAAMHIDVASFRRELPTVLTLAFPGVLVAVGGTAGLLYAGLGLTGLVPDFGWSHAFLFASVIAATDPISVLALFKELGVPRRLYLLVEGESLLNDGVAVVVFVIVAAVLGLPVGHGDGHAVELHGLAAIGSYGLKTFLWMAGGGVVVGLLVGGAAAAATRTIDDHLIEVTLTTLVAYGSFLLAETIGASGVLSTVTAGIVSGSVGRHYGMSVSTRVAVADFWEYMAFIANSFIFLLIGLELEPATLARTALAIAVGFVAVTAARALVVYSGVALAGRFAPPVPLAWRHVMVWGGLRGSLSMVLILTVPLDFPGRSTLVSLVFGVVAVSLFLQGLTIKPLLAAVGLREVKETRVAYERARLQALSSRAAVEALEQLHHHGQVGDQAFERLLGHYTAARDRADALAREHVHGSAVDEQLVEGLKRLIDAEQDTVRHALATGLVSSEVANELSASLAARVEHLDEMLHHDEAHRRVALEGLLSPREGEASPGP